MKAHHKFFSFCAFSLSFLLILQSTSYAMADTTDMEMEENEGMYSQDAPDTFSSFEELLKYKIHAVLDGKMKRNDARIFIEKELFNAIRKKEIEATSMRKILDQFDNATKNVDTIEKEREEEFSEEDFHESEDIEFDEFDEDHFFEDEKMRLRPRMMREEGEMRREHFEEDRESTHKPMERMEEMKEAIMDEFDPDMNHDGEVDEFEKMIESCLEENGFKMGYCQKAVRGDLRDKWKDFDEEDENFEFDFKPEEFEHMQHFGQDFNPRMFERVEDESFFDEFDPDFFNHTDIDKIPADVLKKVDVTKFNQLKPELFERMQNIVPEKLQAIPKKVKQAAEFMLDDVPEDLLEEFGFAGAEAEKVKKLMKAVNKRKREKIVNALDDIDQSVREGMMNLQEDFGEEVSGFMEYLPQVPENARENFVKHKKNFLEHAKRMEEKFGEQREKFDRTTEELLGDFQDVVEKYNFVGESADELQELVDEFLDEVDDLSDEEIKETVRGLHEEMKRLREASKQDKFAQGIIPFRDTDDDQWFTTFVSEAAGNGVIGGYKDANGNPLGEFRPANKVLISEAIKMAVASAGLSESNEKPSLESAKNHWVAGWVKTAEDNDMSVSVDDVNKEATRGEVVRWAIESFGIIPPSVEESSFSDVRSDDKNLDYIEYAKEMGIISGDGDTGKFRPNDSIIRAEVAKILQAAAEVFAE